MMAAEDVRELVGFLEARISEDEARARRWFAEWGERGGVIDLVLTPGPARVLAECEAKRAIIEVARETAEDEGEYDGWRRLALEPVQALASVYAGHPDFDPEWRLP